MELSQTILVTLKKEAENICQKAYAPYSNFKVGAAVLDNNDALFSGTNVENASFGLTICAERSAIFSAIAKGADKIKAVVIYTNTQTPTPPCGACLQVIKEFSDKDTIIYSFCKNNEFMMSSINELLPNSFRFK